MEWQEILKGEKIKQETLSARQIRLAQEEQQKKQPAPVGKHDPTVWQWMNVKEFLLHT